VTGPKKIGGGAAWSAQFSIVAYLFEAIFSKELMLYRYACSIITFRRFLASYSQKYYYENWLSIIKSCKTMHGEHQPPSKFMHQQQ